ncbi:LacI family transcriptional regulator [Weissella uvarum]|uniref:LacI family DNA-binding transcriptional regulator n=1 Tax=Weissella uvarum TaxID=1479233 RepID=UPI001961F265|nr:LacI family DNA-binding transcriptional regulator [Weissella uvarum]MBM7616584.1 LacI family transcriptional regulator [Weissella uvarum]MCM0594957.1 LacI family DNA-binding transcriptional regulator [Weissella uvarum]
MSTIKDIAKRTGLSTATVSRVLNQKGKYTQATADKIHQAVQDLDYKINTSARELVTQESNVVMVMVNHSATNFSTQIMQGILSVAQQNGLTIMVIYAGDDAASQQAALDTVSERPVRALLIISVPFTEVTLMQLHDTHIPYLFVSMAYPGTEIPFISSDDYQIGYQATEYLIEAGHTKIGLAGIDPTSYVGEQRQAGYLAALAEHELAMPDELIHTGDYSYATGQQAMTAYHQQADTPTAIVGGSDLVTVGLLNQAQVLGLTVPDDLTLISIDGTELTWMMHPNLTSVTQDFRAMGEKAMQELLDTDFHPNALTSTFIDFKIDARESTEKA